MKSYDLGSSDFYYFFFALLISELKNRSVGNNALVNLDSSGSKIIIFNSSKLYMVEKVDRQPNG